MLVDSTKVVETDKWFNDNETNAEFTNRVFVRLIAKGRRFTNVNFQYTTFDACYLRDCIFDSCTFTGCRFVNTNLHGAKFSGCKFEYATFEKTDIDNAILDSECPGSENLKLRFARSLRVNYQQLGDVRSGNKAIMVELRATAVHLRKIWSSNESYYRGKYKGWRRLGGFFDWLTFKVLDYIWGNGESAWKLGRAVVVFMLLMAVVDAVVFDDGRLVSSYWNAFLKSPQIMLGTVIPADYPMWYLTLIQLIRLIAFGFFMSIVIKRFNRR